MIDNQNAYEQFVREITEEVRQTVGTDWLVVPRKERKNNSVILDGIMLQRENEKVAPNIYLHPYFTKYCEGESIAQLAKQIMELCNEKRDEMTLLAEKLDFSAEYIKEHLYYRLVNKSRNEELLQEVPHCLYLDLAVVYFWVVYEDGKQLGSIMMNYSQMERISLTEEELLELAVVNTPRMFPAVIKGMDEVVKELMTGKVDFPMFVLSNEIGINGASCLMYPDVAEKIEEKLQGSFYVLPSSVHEVIAIPGNSARTGHLCEMVYCINRTQLPEEDILSDNIYYYNAEDKVLQLVCSDIDKISESRNADVTDADNREHKKEGA